MKRTASAAGSPAIPAASRSPVAALACAALAFAALPFAVPAEAASPVFQVAASNLDFTVVQPGAAAPAPRYEKAPVPNADALAPAYAALGASDPLQPSVISRSSAVGESDGFSHASSQQSTLDSRMKPGLGFALHLPTE